MWHIAVIISSIVVVAYWRVGAVEDETVHASAIDYGVEVVDWVRDRWVPQFVDTVIHGAIVGFKEGQESECRKYPLGDEHARTDNERYQECT